MTGPIFEHPLVHATLTNMGEAVVVIDDEATVDLVQQALNAVKQLDFKLMTSIYWDETLQRDVMVFSR